MSEEPSEADKKFALLLQRCTKLAKDLQGEGYDIDQTLTILFASAGVTVACSTEPKPLLAILDAANKCFAYGAKTQGVDL